MRISSALVVAAILLLGCNKVQEGAIVTSKATLEFKSFPFDKPGVKELMRAHCEQSGEGKSAKGTGCSLDTFSYYDYGNLKEAPFHLKFDSDGSLKWAITMFDVALTDDLVKALKVKYQDPQITNQTVQNQLGTKFERQTFLWRDSVGNELRITTLTPDRDKTLFEFMSSEILEQGKTERKEREKKDSSNL